MAEFLSQDEIDSLLDIDCTEDITITCEMINQTFV